MISWQISVSTVLLVAVSAACATTPPSPAPTPASAAAPSPPPPVEPVTPAAEIRDSVRARDEAVKEVEVRPKLATVRLAFTGDVNLGTTTLPAGIPPDSGRGVLRASAPFLVGDLVIANLEGVFADTGVSEKCLRRVGKRVVERENCYAFRTPTFLAERLSDAGVTHVNLANNHSGDLGSAGRVTTLATVARAGLTAYGLLDQVAYDTLQRGDSVTIVALVGFATYPFAYNLLEIERSAAIVDSVRPLADILIVTFHGGAEGSAAQSVPDGPEYLGREPRGELRRWARAVLDAGADAVVGHGPHVLRGIEFHGGKPIVYSLGNFATYRGFNVSGPLGLTGVLTLELGGDGTFQRGHFESMRQAPRRGPAPDPTREALRVLRRLSTHDFGANAARIEDDGSIAAPAQTSH